MVKPTQASGYDFEGWEPGSGELEQEIEKLVRENLDVFRQSLELEVDAAYAPDGNSACEDDMTIELIDPTGSGARVLSCSMKAAIDAMVEECIEFPDGSSLLTKNMRAISDYLLVSADRLEREAPDEPIGSGE